MIGEPVPSSLGGDSAKNELESVVREFVVIPGVARHGEARRWFTMGEVPALSVRADSPEDGYIATLEGHFAVFNRWTEINSFFEGRFLESLAPGAFKKTFQENMKGMRCLFQHGRDPQIGMKPLGPIREVSEDSTGARYGVPMIDTSYNRDLLPVLKDGLCGASFRFQVMREEVNSEPSRSSYNPDGIEERVIKECKVREFGPVTFPAYEDATAGVRSLEDWWHGTGDDADPVRLSTLRSAMEDLLVRSVERDGTSTDDAEARERAEAEAAEAAERADKDGDGSTAPPEDPRTRRPVPSARRGHSPRLPGAASALRTTTDREEPKWRL